MGFLYVARATLFRLASLYKVDIENSKITICVSLPSPVQNSHAVRQYWDTARKYAKEIS